MQSLSPDMPIGFALYRALYKAAFFIFYWEKRVILILYITYQMQILFEIFVRNMLIGYHMYLYINSCIHKWIMDRRGSALPTLKKELFFFKAILLSKWTKKFYWYLCSPLPPQVLFFPVSDSFVLMIIVDPPLI